MENFVEKLVEKWIDSHKMKMEAKNNENLTPKKKARIEQHFVGDHLAKLNLIIMTGLLGNNF